MDSLELFFVIAFAVWAIVHSVYWRYRKKNRVVTMTNSPILFSYYSDESTILPITRGEQNDFEYAVYAFMGGPEATNSLLIEVYLPFKTKLHLLGITKRKGMDQIRTDSIGSVMEKVSLEGDYDSHFSLFTDKGMQTQVRYVLDPKAMAFTIDFCKSHSWEIVGSEFYFVQQSVPNAQGDPTYMWDDIERFIEEIRPAVEVPLTDQESRLRRPYKEATKDIRVELFKDLKCPICSGALKHTGDMYECLIHDGVLIESKNLSKLRKGKIAPSISSKYRHVKREESLICPYCGTEMQNVEYAGSKIMIDNCPKCHRRWLDSGELVGLRNPLL